MKVHKRLRIPSERFSSFTRRMTRKSRKNLADTLRFSEDWAEEMDHFILLNFNKPLEAQNNLPQLPALDLLPAETDALVSDF